MTDEAMQRIIDGQIVERYVTIYKSNLDDEMKHDLAQEIYLILLETLPTEKYQAIEDKFSYLCSICKNQLNSSSSYVYRKYFHTKVKYEDTIGNNIIVAINDDYNEEDY